MCVITKHKKDLLVPVGQHREPPGEAAEYVYTHSISKNKTERTRNEMNISIISQEIYTDTHEIHTRTFEQ